ncbi:hypothetical protein [Massilia timonae]|uniref:hypothetical protein n=1 Tax=Massilia timonae TaxID=47229 RepID=UPI0028A8B822|nr:hypothetical protein [Massilia timonae]
MMRTPEQACATWCPMARGERMATSNRCIADECAMWRWGEYVQELRPKVVDDPAFGPGGKRMTQVSIAVPTKGYCGLAGAPVIAGGTQ